MMQFLTRMRLSRCHDDGRAPSPRLRDQVARSGPLTRYARSLDAIDRELSDSAPIERPSPRLIRRTLEAVSEVPAASMESNGFTRAPLWPLLSSLTVAAIAVMLFVSRPWQSPRSFAPSHPAARTYTPRDLGLDSAIVTNYLGPNESVTREAAALVEESRNFANSLLRDALPFATGAGRGK